MTIPAIHTDQPGASAKAPTVFMPETVEAVPATPVRESLREVTDQAKLSSLAPRIKAVLSEIGGADGNVMTTLASNIDRLQEGFLDTLHTTLSDENIDLTEKLTLRLSTNNILTVAGDHPGKERVEQILAETPALSEAFCEIASQSEVMRDISNISKVMTRQTAADAYDTASREQAAFAVYQMSLKGDMSHFYFSKG